MLVCICSYLQDEGHFNTDSFYIDVSSNPRHGKWSDVTVYSPLVQTSGIYRAVGLTRGIKLSEPDPATEVAWEQLAQLNNE
jgi:hypothetical protein